MSIHVCGRTLNFANDIIQYASKNFLDLSDEKCIRYIIDAELSTGSLEDGTLIEPDVDHVLQTYTDKELASIIEQHINWMKTTIL